MPDFQKDFFPGDTLQCSAIFAAPLSKTSTQFSNGEHGNVICNFALMQAVACYLNLYASQVL